MMPAPLKPAKPVDNPYTIPSSKLKMRASELPGITSVTIKELFPELPNSIPLDDEIIRKATIEAMTNIDLSKIQPADSVNILASHHGFCALEGGPYAQMIRTIRDQIEKRTGSTDIRLRAGNGLRYRESEVYIKKFGLDEYFKGKAKNISPLGRGLKINTILGPLYGLQEIYDAKWIIHAHSTDAREFHLHRVVDRIVKPFAMSYARIETRSAYHVSLGPRAGNVLARAIFDSDFVQEKFAGSVLLKISPRGVMGIDADNDLLKQNDRTTKMLLEHYGKLITLLNELDNKGSSGCIIVLDSPCSIPYVSSGGLILGGFLQMGVDVFDLSKPVPPYNTYGKQHHDENGVCLVDEIPPISSSIRAMVNNYSFKGFPITFFIKKIPSVIVGEELKELFKYDEQAPTCVESSFTAIDLPNAMDLVKKMTRCENILIFDGAVGGMNVSESLRMLFLEKAPDVSKKVDNELLPLWLKQRGIL